MADVNLIRHGDHPESYLIEQVPGLALVRVGFEQSAQWVLLAIGAPMFSEQEEAEAQHLMRRYGLDAQRFSEPHQAAVALHKALERENLS